MKTRTLLDGSEVPEYKENILLQIITHCPNKWKLIDMQTGEEYIGQKPIGGEKQVMHWRKVTKDNA